MVVRTGHNTDPVTRTWWTSPPEKPIAGAADPELYRYGVHAPEFWVNLTVGPGGPSFCSIPLGGISAPTASTIQTGSRPGRGSCRPCPVILDSFDRWLV